MRIVVTGNAGYIGSKLVYLLAEAGHYLVGVDSLYFRQWSCVEKSVSRLNKFIQCDVRELSQYEDEVRKADLVIPLACHVGMPLCAKHPKESEEVNLWAIKELISMLNPAQRVIFPNSNSGIGAAKGICDENVERNALSDYGKQKDSAEDYIRANHANSVVFRLATVYGQSFRTRLDLLINSLCYEAYFTGKIELFDGHYKRNYVHVNDVCRAFMFAIDHFDLMKGNVYNLGDDSLNSTKLVLAQKIQKQIPCEIVNSDKTDPDKRDYIVTSKKLYDLGYNCLERLEGGIEELKYFFSTLPKNENDRILSIRMLRNA